MLESQTWSKGPAKRAKNVAWGCGRSVSIISSVF